MRPAIILPLVTAFAVAAILYLLHRLGGFQRHSGPTSSDHFVPPSLVLHPQCRELY